MEPVILFEHETGTYKLPFASMDAETLNGIIKLALDSEYIPIRITLVNLKPEQNCVFNAGAINNTLIRWHDKVIPKYFEILGHKVEKKPSPFIKDNFGIDLADYITESFSNERFWVELNDQNELKTIYLTQEKSFFFFHVPIYDGETEYPRFSNGFVDSSLTLKDSLTCRKIEATRKDGTKYTAVIKSLSMSEILSITDETYVNYCKGRGSYTLDPYEHIADQVLLREFKTRQLSAANISMSFSDNQKDEEIIKYLKSKLAHSKIFELADSHVPGSTAIDTTVYAKPAAESGVEVRVYDRNKHIPLENKVKFPALKLHKENFSFEREKTLTLIFAEIKVEQLQSAGFTDIKIHFETPVAKKDGSPRGYLDLSVYGTKAGQTYGQVYEMKAWATVSASGKTKLDFQCENYDIETIVKKNGGVDNSFSTVPFTKVIGHNLTLLPLKMKDPNLVGEIRSDLV